MENITVYGAGYVGLVTAVCLSHLGHYVHCVDIDVEKIKLCQAGKAPIYETGLEAMMQASMAAQTLTFSDELSIATGHGDIHFIAVGTPIGAQGQADLSAYWQVVDRILSTIKRDSVLVTKSTVPAGTAKQLRARIGQQHAAAPSLPSVQVVSNPEFLRQGTAVHDFMHADRIVIGAEQMDVGQRIALLYRTLVDSGVPVMQVDCATAELIKYAANAFLATKISFINELSHIAESVGADIQAISQGIGMDSRINPKFLNAGCGYGGSCFPKDVPALIAMAKEHDCHTWLLSAVDQVNQYYKRVLFDKANDYYSANWLNKHVGIWGLAFKPGTDDLRQAPSEMLLRSLWAERVLVKAYDPLATQTAAKYYADQPDLVLVEDLYAAADGVDALFIMTECPQFQTVDWSRLARMMKHPVIFDGRNNFDPAVMRAAGFTYVSIGRSTVDAVQEATLEVA